MQLSDNNRGLHFIIQYFFDYDIIIEAEIIFQKDYFYYHLFDNF